MADEGENNSLLQGIQKSIYINAIQSSTTTHEVFIDDYIEEPHKYRQLISLLINAPASDKIHIYVNSNGGNLDSACAIINAMMVSQAEVTAFLMGACHSAASMLTMYCHNVHVFDSAYMMIHTASFASSGNTPTIKAHTDFTISQVSKLLDDCYDGFLDDKEMTQVKNGIEIWLDADAIRKRLKKRFKSLEDKQKKNAIKPKDEVVEVTPDGVKEAEIAPPTAKKKKKELLNETTS